MIGGDAVLAARELGHAADAQEVGAEALDLGAERDEKATQILDVRLAGGVADDRLALGQHRRHDHVLGSHHARLVEEELATAQLVDLHRVVPLGLDLNAEIGEGLDVRVEPAATDHVAARRRDLDRAGAGQQRAGQQEGGADATAKLGVEVGVGDLGGLDSYFVRARPLGGRAGAGNQVDHVLDVEDARHVAQRHRLGRE